MKYQVGDVLFLKKGGMATVLYVNEKLQSYHVSTSWHGSWGFFYTDIKEDEIESGTPATFMAEIR